MLTSTLLSLGAAAEQPNRAELVEGRLLLFRDGWVRKMTEGRHLRHWEGRGNGHYLDGHRKVWRAQLPDAQVLEHLQEDMWPDPQV